jgi:VTC domain
MSEPLKREFRYERKFSVEDLDANCVRVLVNQHPSMFYETYPPRVVNNIYLDTIDMENYHANVNGIGKRQKVRIRWYGDMYGQIVCPMLEFKVKSGSVGAKYSYTFAPFQLERGFSQAYLEKMIKESDLPDDAQLYLRTLEAVLCNNYYRYYYASRDHRFRLTVDKDMAYYQLKKANNNFRARWVDTRKTIVELKYEKQFDQHASRVASYFPFSATRSSKYVTGINFVYS